MEIRTQTCAWCGKLFEKPTKAKYCSKECCEAVRKAVREAKSHGIRLTADGVILKHKMDLKENPAPKTTRLVPIHTSSGMMWARKEV